MNLQIVCRGSRAEGLGHLFRARTFALAATTRHDVQVIAITEPELRSLLDDLGARVRFVDSDAEVPPLVRGRRPNVLALDLTRLDEAAFRACRSAAGLTVSLSPIFEHMSGVDSLFTRAARTPPIAGVKLFAGLQYAVFGGQCRPIDDAAYTRALEQPCLPIAICMGGADAANKSLRVLQALVARERASAVWVLLGEGYAHSYDALVETARVSRRHEVILAKTSRSMWQVLGNCAVAILAGGLTTVEAVYAGLPSVNLFERPEHAEMVQELFDAGVCVNGGLFSDGSLATLTATLDRLDTDRTELARMRRASCGLIDGRGCERILSGLERLISEQVPAAGREVETLCHAG